MTSVVPFAEVIGDPISHSKSPLIHRFWLRKIGLDGDYLATRVAPEEIDDFFESRSANPGWLGCSVTLPLKIAVIPHLQLVSPAAQRIGAVNTIVSRGGELSGWNTDEAGFLDPLRGRQGTIRSAVLIGAGGAARAVLAGLREMGTGQVTLVNRDQGRARALAEEWPQVQAVVPLSPGLRLKAADLVVNATSLGMDEQPPLDVDLSGLAPGTLIYDIVYAPLETALLKQARALGLPVVDGLQMLVGQAAVAFSLLFGHDPPRAHDAELRTLLTA